MPGYPVPISLLPLVLPQAEYSVQCGFPSPADDFACRRIDLTEQLVEHPQATFLLKVRGDSMKEVGIFDGDVLVVDRAINPVQGHIVVAVLDGGEFTVKTLQKRAGRPRLVAANPTYPDIVPKDGQTLEIWGVVTASIKQFRK